MLRSAHEITTIDDPLMAEMWASGWLGNAWSDADLGNREPEHELCMEVVGRACTKPAPHGTAAVCALLRVAQPGEHNDTYIEHRALAWARSRDNLPPLGDYQPLPDDERDRLLEAFVAEHPGSDVELTRSLAETFLEYGDGYNSAGPLAWSPAVVELFLLDYLPRKVMLDAQHRDHLPDTLKLWVAFALRERGVEPRWITPVTDAVTALAADFRDEFDRGEGWGPAKQIAAELLARGVDLSDKESVDTAMRELNAERLARRLTE